MKKYTIQNNYDLNLGSFNTEQEAQLAINFFLNKPENRGYHSSDFWTIESDLMVQWLA